MNPREAIASIVDRLKNLDISRVVVFGSTVTGTFDEDSDVALAVIVPDPGPGEKFNRIDVPAHAIGTRPPPAVYEVMASLMAERPQGYLAAITGLAQSIVACLVGDASRSLPADSESLAGACGMSRTTLHDADAVAPVPPTAPRSASGAPTTSPPISRTVTASRPPRFERRIVEHEFRSDAYGAAAPRAVTLEPSMTP